MECVKKCPRNTRNVLKIEKRLTNVLWRTKQMLRVDISVFRHPEKEKCKPCSNYYDAQLSTVDLAR